MTEISETNEVSGNAPKRTGVITRYARAWERGDFGEIVECYDEQIVAHYGGQSDFAGTYTGRDQFLTLLLETGSRGRRKLIAIDQLHDDGSGGKLVAHVEAVLQEKGERVLIIETSGVPSFEPTRAFYRNHGYTEEARIREFYGPGDDKIVFWKALYA